MNTKFIVIVLIVIAVAAGYWLWSSQSPQTSPQESQETVADTASLIRELSDDEKEVLSIPPSTASAALRQKHFELAASLAKEAAVEVAHCLPNPVVVKANINGEITFKNGSEYDVVLDIAGVSRTIRPKSQIAVRASFGQGGGLYGYGCNTTAPGTDGTGAGLIFLIAE